MSDVVTALLCSSLLEAEPESKTAFSKDRAGVGPDSSSTAGGREGGRKRVREQESNIE